MAKRYPIYTRIKGDRTVYVLDLGCVYDPAVGKVRRKQQQFSKRKLAEDERKNLIERQDTSGPSAAMLSFDQRIDARRAIDILAGKATLTDAAAAFIQSSSAEIVDKLIETAVAEWVESKRLSNRRLKTVQDASSRGSVLAKIFAGRNVASITGDDLLNWMGCDCPPGSRKNYRTIFHSFWAYAVNQGWARSNIVASISIPAVDQSDPRIFDLKSVIRLLRSAESYCPQILPYFTIGLFAGLRPENELQNLDWSNVSLTKNTIRVTAATAKRRRKRIVAVSDNLACWLKAHIQPDGKIFYSRRIADRIKSLAGIEWHPDIMRHTYGSYHLARHNAEREVRT